MNAPLRLGLKEAAPKSILSYMVLMLHSLILLPIRHRGGRKSDLLIAPSTQPVALQVSNPLQHIYFDAYAPMQPFCPQPSELLSVQLAQKGSIKGNLALFPYHSRLTHLHAWYHGGAFLENTVHIGLHIIQMSICHAM